MEENIANATEARQNEIPQSVSVNFSMLVSMLSTSALQHLGLIMNPLTGKVEKNLQEAKIVIDILDILERKTKGNLTDEEKSLLGQTLTTLKLNFVEQTKETTDNKTTKVEDNKQENNKDNKEKK